MFDLPAAPAESLPASLLPLREPLAVPGDADSAWREDGAFLTHGPHPGAPAGPTQGQVRAVSQGAILRGHPTNLLNLGTVRLQAAFAFPPFHLGGVPLDEQHIQLPVPPGSFMEELMEGEAQLPGVLPGHPLQPFDPSMAPMQQPLQALADELLSSTNKDETFQWLAKELTSARQGEQVPGQRRRAPRCRMHRARPAEQAGASHAEGFSRPGVPCCWLSIRCVACPPRRPSRLAAPRCRPDGRPGGQNDVLHHHQAPRVQLGRQVQILQRGVQLACSQPQRCCAPVCCAVALCCGASPAGDAPWALLHNHPAARNAPPPSNFGCRKQNSHVAQASCPVDDPAIGNTCHLLSQYGSWKVPARPELAGQQLQRRVSAVPPAPSSLPGASPWAGQRNAPVGLGSGTPYPPVQLQALGLPPGTPSHARCFTPACAFKLLGDRLTRCRPKGSTEW